jgi:hypothetical protein
VERLIELEGVVRLRQCARALSGLSSVETRCGASAMASGYALYQLKGLVWWFYAYLIDFIDIFYYRCSVGFFSMISKGAPLVDQEPSEGSPRCARYAMTQRDYRKLRGETWNSSTFGKAAKKLYRTLYSKEPPNEPTRAKKRDPVPVYPCGVLEETYRSLRKGGPLCVFYELTQQEFRRRRGEKWSPSFISSFGKLASKLYRALYKKEPPDRSSADELHDLVNAYPRGVLEQAYARLKADGVETGEPYRKPDPSLRPLKPEKPEPALPSDPKQRARAERVRFSFGRGWTTLDIIEKKRAQRLADIAAGKDYRPEPYPYDWVEPFLPQREDNDE